MGGEAPFWRLECHRALTNKATGMVWYGAARDQLARRWPARFGEQVTDTDATLSGVLEPSGVHVTVTLDWQAEQAEGRIEVGRAAPTAKKPPKRPPLPSRVPVEPPVSVEPEAAPPAIPEAAADDGLAMRLEPLLTQGPGAARGLLRPETVRKNALGDAIRDVSPSPCGAGTAELWKRHLMQGAEELVCRREGTRDVVGAWFATMRATLHPIDGWSWTLDDETRPFLRLVGRKPDHPWRVLLEWHYPSAGAHRAELWILPR